jgi:tetratricopeptide (TPR) repeat protein
MRLTVLVAVVLAAANNPPEDRGSKTGIFSITDIVTDAVQHGKSISFPLFNGNAALDIDSSDAQELAALTKIVGQSVAANRRISFDFDASTGTVSSIDGRMHYRLCGAQFDELLAIPSLRCGASTRPTKSGDADRISLAVAQAEYGDPALGLSMLDDTTLASLKSRSALIVALKARGEAIDGLIDGMDAVSDEGDRLLLAELSDVRRLRNLLPDDSQFPYAEASSLELLGDYDGASRVYDAIARRWPDEEERLMMRRAALERQRGAYERSLDYLSQFAGQSSALGMPFYYHRGWTLADMGRFDEAIASFTEGMSYQHDYAWAFLRRGCACEAIGNITKAIDDFNQASVLFERDPPARSKAVAVVKAAVSSETHRLKDSKTSGANGSCAFLGKLSGTRRTRSSLFKTS